MPEPGHLLILASASPRRSALLTQIGVFHRVVPPDLEESRLDAEPVEQCVRRLAEQKALRVHARLLNPEVPVLGADTAVVLDGDMLGKPRDREHALAMLARLSAREHEVISAVALARSGAVSSRLSRSVVCFRTLLPAECEAYWDSGEPHDKAGAYAVQGRGAVFVQALRGSYSGVVGLPLFETAALLAATGVPMWQS
ncbi:MAG TPA: Maf family protein [Steroidobacteraceae bacterium]